MLHEAVCQRLRLECKDLPVTSLTVIRKSFDGRCLPRLGTGQGFRRGATLRVRGIVGGLVSMVRYQARWRQKRYSIAG